MSLAYVEFLNGRGDPPSAQQLEEAKRKRAVANDLFSIALGRWREGGRGPLGD